MAALSRIAERLLARPLLLAPVLGAVAALGFEPLHLWPLTLLSVAWLTVATATAQSRFRAFLTGWLWAVGHFCTGSFWIATSFTYQAEMPASLGFLGVFLLSLYLAVYPGLAALAAWHARRRPLALVLAFAAAWIVSEWLRSWVFTGFAWNPLGIALLGPFDGQGLAPLAKVIGTYGLSGVLVLVSGLLLGIGRNRRGLMAGLALLVVLAPMLLTGLIPPPQGKMRYTLIQPNIAQQDIANPDAYEDQFQRLAKLSLPRTRGDERLVLWPESGVPDYLREGYPAYFYQESTYAGDPAMARRRIGGVIGPGSLLLTGAVDLDMQGDAIIGARNVVTAIAPDGALRGSYAKAHLVPYGEYLPMRGLLEPLGLSRLVAGSLDFLPGPGPRTLDFGPYGKAGFQVCYEIVFSGQVADRANRPDYIFNPSNDGWFGARGPPQHLAQARLRAIEEGLPVLRSTTNGISAVIDADGIVRQHLPRFVAGRLDGKVPPAHAPTLFARFGNMLPLLLAAILLGLSALVLSRARR
ncbi:apolipoprotein N-acyltransferase [Novosphingobium sp. MW5]|nr:apolipoprotein N-acyltransferase [Novosphingobium sp. MW5]